MKCRRKTNNKALSDLHDKGNKQCKELEAGLRELPLRNSFVNSIAGKGGGHK